MQKAAYSGHKRCHGIKFQNVTTPDGLIAHLYGGIAGSRHDSHMLDNSNILPRLQAAMTGNQQRIYALFGDPAYPQSPHLMGGIQGAAPNSMEAAWNRRMARARICVEWTFGEVGRQFRSLSLKPTMMIYRFPVTKYYFVAVLLMNCRNSLYGSQTSDYFNCECMSLDDYLGLVNWDDEDEQHDDGEDVV